LLKKLFSGLEIRFPHQTVFISTKILNRHQRKKLLICLVIFLLQK